MRKAEYVLALDFGADLGWCTQDSKGLRSGVIRRGKKSMREHLIELNGLLDRDWGLILYEKVSRHLGTAAAHAYGGYLGVTILGAKRASLIGIHVGSIKKSVTGNGHAKKPEMVKAVRDAGFSVTDHNEADAIALMLTAIKQGLVRELK